MPRIAELSARVSVQGVDQAARDLDRLDTKFSATAKGMGSASQGFDKLGAAAALAGSAIVAGLGGGVKVAGDFESTLSGLQAVSGATADEMGQLRKAALGFGQDTTLAGVSAADAAEAMEALAKGGVSVEQQLGGATKGALLLASAGQLDFAEASDIAANALNTFKLSGEDLPRVADLFASAANKSTIEVSDLAQSMQQVGVVAASFGQTIEGTTGVMAAFGAAGLRGSDAGTSLKTALLALVNPSKEARAEMERYGLSFFDANGKMLDFAGIAEQLRGKLDGLTDEQRNATLATIFGTDAIRAATILYNEGGEGVADWTSKVNDAGSAARVGAARNDNLKGSLNQVKDAFETAGIAAGTVLSPALRDVAGHVTGAVNWFNTLDGTTQEVIVTTAAAVGGFALLGGAIIKTTDYARDLAGSVKDVIGWFVKKEAAKKTLTTANEVLAGSVVKTTTAVKGLQATLGAGLVKVALIGVADAAALAAASVGTLAAALAGPFKIKDFLQGAEGKSQELKQMTRDAQAYNLAIQQGASLNDDFAQGFTRYIAEMRASGQTFSSLERAWNSYLGFLKDTGQEHGTLRQVLIATKMPAEDAAAAIMGVTDASNKAAPAATGLVGGANAAAAAMGDMAATGGNLTDIGNRVSKVLDHQGGTIMPALTVGADKLTGTYGNLTKQFTDAEAAARNFGTELGALGQRQGELREQYTLLERRVEALDEKKKAGIALTKEEQDEYDTLKGIMAGLGQEIADNEAKQRDLTIRQIEGQQAAEGLRLKMEALRGELSLVPSATAQASLGVQGLTSGMGDVYTGGPIPGRQHGGPVLAGRPYWVGEDGRPELFVPREAGMIIPSGGLRGGGVTIHAPVTIHNPSVDSRERLAALKAEVMEAVEYAIASGMDDAIRGGVGGLYQGVAQAASSGTQRGLRQGYGPGRVR